MHCEMHQPHVVASDTWSLAFELCKCSLKGIMAQCMSGECQNIVQMVELDKKHLPVGNRRDLSPVTTS